MVHMISKDAKIRFPLPDPKIFGNYFILKFYDNESANNFRQYSTVLSLDEDQQIFTNNLNESILDRIKNPKSNIKRHKFTNEKNILTFLIKRIKNGIFSSCMTYNYEIDKEKCLSTKDNSFDQNEEQEQVKYL